MFLYAISIKTRQASRLISETLAGMTACVDFVATRIHEFDAFWFSTYILEGLFIAERGFRQLFPTKSALESCFEICRFLTASS